jgi:hypothetical protein
MAAAMDDAEQHISTTDARAGATPHVTRYVLGFGLALVILIFVLILLVRS